VGEIHDRCNDQGQEPDIEDVQLRRMVIENADEKPDNQPQKCHGAAPLRECSSAEQARSVPPSFSQIIPGYPARAI
jgi:hypothetical protein